MKNFNRSKIEGIDADIETSLLDYGFAWILSADNLEYKFYYRISGQDESSVFDIAFQPKNLDVKKEYSWIEWDGILSFTGCTESEFFGRELPYIIFDLLSYYGPDNIFGSSYSSYKYIPNINRFKSIY